ncbi:MAG: tRNA (adenosine(37)-N6)-threonylcarbamoyltransferase complex ATPase subunit type 1 TsaE [Candidatus Atelocyanobacterium thalassa]|uniref:tRNA threonylcarbamoyladenosine biosynthesis protein TsaE n=1 Tax=Candidatus Atelocyanobacterium thalassa isolate SIO64986 TaxID=1527444 RepID=A0A086CHJ0_9CHRO|nr:MAG: tRNA threonylcarbamoyl adenosine modification protein YjeE [Candidatus Atelocyanobacterium thalassa isolate SIO64986]
MEKRINHKSIVLESYQGTLDFGEQLGKILPENSTLLLKGDLGAGKTTFVQGIGKGLGIIDPIVSPTFILINEYYQGHLPLYHLDLYRTEKNMVEDLFLEQYWEEQDISPGITVIEWPERLSYLPLNYLKIDFFYISDISRQIILTTVGNFSFDSIKHLN